MPTKIEWTDDTWNPVWGCLNNCKYCYARKIAKRFGQGIYDKEFINSMGMDELEGLKTFKPTWIESNFKKKFPKKPKRIFVNSMSDINYWSASWMSRVLRRIAKNRNHTFQFLTKFPEVYLKYDWPENCWLGVTVTSNDDIEKAYKLENMDIPNLKFISVEPILDNWVLMIPTINLISDWIILGLETNNRNAFMPDLDKVEALVSDAKLSGIPIYMKGSMSKVWPGELIQEFPR